MRKQTKNQQNYVRSLFVENYLKTSFEKQTKFTTTKKKHERKTKENMKLYT